MKLLLILIALILIASMAICNFGPFTLAFNGHVYKVIDVTVMQVSYQSVNLIKSVFAIAKRISLAKLRWLFNATITLIIMVGNLFSHNRGEETLAITISHITDFGIAVIIFMTLEYLFHKICEILKRRNEK